MRAVIGVDTGGTFTDTVVTLSDGRLGVGKALSTPDRVEDGVLDSIGRAAEALSLGLDELLGMAVIVTHGTTVGLNALLTGTGARVGLLTTAGFESTVHIAKANKTHGLSEVDATQPVRWRKPTPLVRRADVMGVPERVDVAGEVLVPLDEPDTVAAIRRLRGVDAVAVALLWSPVRPDHERRVADLVARELPGVHVSVSSSVAPVVGEYERTSTAVLDAYVAPMVASYLGRLADRLRAHGFAGMLMILRMGGGAEPAAQAARVPVHTLRSGPVAGLAAAAAIGAVQGERNIIATDVGGTSFDVGLVIAGEPERAGRPMIDRHALAVPVIEVVSIGTGGGSIAWLDRDLGALRVGPHSAGASPGPVCYGRGGTRPTLTDASAALGYLTRLGLLSLDVDAARAAIERDIAGPLGMTVERAAAGIVRIAADQMRDLIRRTTVQRGHDPSGFTLLAYGGAGPQYACWYADGLRVRDVVVPELAAELSAYGAVASDLVRHAERDVVPVPLDRSLSTVAAALAAALDDLDPGPVAELSTVLGRGHTVRRTVSLRFHRQQRRVELPVESWDAAALPELDRAFRKRYEEIVGPATAPAGTPVEVVAVGVRLTVGVPVPSFAPRPATRADPTGHRTAWFDAAVPCPVYAWAELGAGQAIPGPAFIESAQTTVIVPPGHHARADAAGHLHLSGGSACSTR
jgi:N-methylhydantoinase A